MFDCTSNLVYDRSYVAKIFVGKDVSSDSGQVKLIARLGNTARVIKICTVMFMVFSLCQKYRRRSLFCSKLKSLMFLIATLKIKCYRNDKQKLIRQFCFQTNILHASNNPSGFSYYYQYSLLKLLLLLQISKYFQSVCQIVLLNRWRIFYNIKIGCMEIYRKK